MRINELIKGKRGITTFEFLVVVSVIGILSALMVANYRAFERQNVLGNLAQDIALSIRLTQSYGLYVQGQTGVDNFQVSYGIRFDENTPQKYFIYRNELDRKDYTYALGDRRLDEYSIGGGYAIQNVCVTNTGGDDCWGSGTDVVEIAFDRPKPDAHFLFNGVLDDTYTHATIVLRDQNGLTRNIIVRVTGYVSVQ